MKLLRAAREREEQAKANLQKFLAIDFDSKSVDAEIVEEESDSKLSFEYGRFGRK